MADERDPKLSQHYRDLEPLEPPSALDQKILAAARQAAESPHAPLVAPAGRHRWYYSLAAAAVLVFAIALTLHIDRERPDPEAVPSSAVRGEIKQPPRADAAPRAEPQGPPAFTPDPQPSERRDAAPASPAPRAQAERSRAEQSGVSAEALRARAAAEARSARDAAAEQQAAAAKQQAAASRLAASSAAAPVAAAPESPDRWLERIAELRSRGRHADADRELANFRKAYPNYPLSNVMRERVEGTPTPAAQ